MVSAIYLLIILYCLWVLWISIKLENLKIESLEDYSPNPSTGVGPQICVVVVFRNEKKNISNLMNDLMKQKIQKGSFEIIMVNDNSTDGSRELIIRLSIEMENLRLLNLEYQENQSPKKRAIEMALIESSSPYILFTDADCRVEPFWVGSYLKKVKEEDSLLIGGLVFKDSKGIRGKWERMESLILASFSALGFLWKSPFMANGGNLLISRELADTDPFKENINRISGDDISLLNSVIKMDRRRIGFNNYKNSFVFTSESGSFSDFMNQKIRWAGKWKLFENGKFSIIPILLFLFNLFYSGFMALGLFLLFDVPLFWIAISIKVISDMILTKTATRKFTFPISWTGFFLFEIIFSFYFILFGSISNMIPYSWKDRKISNHGGS